MSLTLENISRVVDGVDYIRDANITFEAGSFNVLLGRTLAGKTSLMRLMAGLDKPDDGRLIYNGNDVTGQSVQQRNVSMIYQQFINYPNLTVYENIASPLRLAKMKESEIDRRVKETANMLQIDPLLKRYPLELSGGQQQRTAMARALVKDATLILFDEPLVNLDYKLREELRAELRELFRERQCIAVYATTEANEALALGGVTTLLNEGRIVQTGPVMDVYRNPVNTLAAQLFSEPPMNMIKGRVTDTEVTFDEYSHHALTQELARLEPGALAHVEIVEVMPRRNLHCAAAQFGIGMFVRHDGHAPACDGEDDLLADDGLVTLVRGVHRHRHIGQHGFGARGRDFDVVLPVIERHTIGERVFEVPEAAGNRLLLDLEVADRSAQLGVPVHQPLVAVDQPLVV